MPSSSLRRRLFDAQSELDAARSARDDGAAAWIAKARALEAEVDWATDMADGLAARNTNLRAASAKLR